MANMFVYFQALESARQKITDATFEDSNKLGTLSQTVVH